MQPDRPQLCRFWLAGVVGSLGGPSATAATEIPPLQALSLFLWHFSFAAVPLPVRWALCRTFGVVLHRPQMAQFTADVISPGAESPREESSREESPREESLAELADKVWCAHAEGLCTMLATDDSFRKWAASAAGCEAIERANTDADEALRSVVNDTAGAIFAVFKNASELQQPALHGCASVGPFPTTE